MASTFQPITLTLTEEELDRFTDTLEQVPYLIIHARQICIMVADALTDARASDPGLISVLEMVAKGFEAAEGREAAAADALCAKLRHVKGDLLNRRRAAELAAQKEGGLGDFVVVPHLGEANVNERKRDDD
jgi:hypothetical protein